MRDAIVLAVFGFLAALLAFLMRNVGKVKQETKAAEGVIDNVVHTQSVIYYGVAFTAEGRTMRGESIPYSSAPKRLRNGDNVSINYFFTKVGKPKVIILDDELKSCAASAKLLPKALRWISAAFFLVAIIMLIQSMV